MTKKLLVGLIAIFISLLSTGCSSNASDVENYLKEKYHLDNFTVSKTYKERKSDGYHPDEIWTVKLNDGSNITFNVINTYIFQSSLPSHKFQTDFDFQVLKYLIKKYGQLHALECVKEEGDYSAVKTFLKGNYNNAEELEQLLTETWNFLEFANNFNYEISFDLVFNYKNKKLPNINVQTTYNRMNTIQSKVFPSIGQSLLLRKKAFEKYIYEMLYNKLSDDDIEKYSNYVNLIVNNSEYKLAYKNALGEYVYYSDLIAHNSYISYRTLYEILKRNGYNVQGSIDNYKFYTSNGECIYNDTKGGYCLNDQNNQQSFSIDLETVKKLTGIDLKNS